MILDRAYQIEAVQSIYTYFSQKQGNPVVAMPTGTGKSVVIARFLESVFRQYSGQKILCLTHVKELIQQNYDKLLSVWPNAPAGIYSAGLKRRDTMNQIVFAGIASIAKCWEQFGVVHLLIIDEAHMVNPKEETMYKKVIEGLTKINPFLKVIGLTATPWRLGHGRITEDGIFTDICFDITGLAAFNRLIAEGYLSPLVTKKTVTELDTTGVHIRGGEFIQSELQLAVDKKEITEAAIREALEVGHDRHHWLVFCAGVEHAIHTAEVMNYYGIPTAALHSNLSDGERDQIIKDYKAGKYRAVTNNNVLTTGFDFPGIDLILMLRPTISPVLWVQMLGRGTRPVYALGFDLNTIDGRLRAIETGPKQNCLVLDFSGNSRKLGPINDPVIPKKKGEKGGEAPIKICECCSMYNHASARYCGGKSKDDPEFNFANGCGNEFPIMTKLMQAASTADVIKGDLPITEVFKVDHITYIEHRKHDKPPAMKVTYYCGFKHFEEYVCIEHDNFASKRARDWWRQRSPNSVPDTTAEALARAGELSTATHLRVWTNKKYPEILAYCYDGTCFGTQEASDSDAGPTTKIHGESNEVPGNHIQFESGKVSDDIPF